jgi:hypothetical protein
MSITFDDGGGEPAAGVTLVVAVGSGRTVAVGVGDGFCPSGDAGATVARAGAGPR